MSSREHIKPLYWGFLSDQCHCNTQVTVAGLLEKLPSFAEEHPELGILEVKLATILSNESKDKHVDTFKAIGCPSPRALALCILQASRLGCSLLAVGVCLFYYNGSKVVALCSKRLCLLARLRFASMALSIVTRTFKKFVRRNMFPPNRGMLHTK